MSQADNLAALGSNVNSSGVLQPASGGTGTTSTAAAPFALKGANSDITSLTGLTTPLSVAQGGTGLTSPGTNGNVLTSNGTAWVSSTPAAGGVTSVATGNGLTGGTITSTGTLSIAAPSYGSVGSYVMAALSSGMTNQQNYSATKTVTAYFSLEGTGDFFYTTNLSGTWRWLGATVAGQYGDRLATVCVRVS